MMQLVLKQNFVSFEGKFYQQLNGLPIGSAISPFLAELFMKNFEEHICTQHWFPKTWFRYVDDIFAVVKQDDVQNVFDFLNNTKYSSIKFSMEKEQDGCIPFLDLKIKRFEGSFHFSIYRKPTDTPLYIQAKSFHSKQHKKAAFEFMIQRLITIPMNETDYESEWKYILTIARLNGYNEQMCKDIMNKKIERENLKNITSLKILEKDNKDFIPVPFYPPYTNQLSTILNKHNIQLTYNNPRKMAEVLGTSKEGKIDNKMKSGIYKIDCLNCEATYIGQTKRTLQIRELEHKDQNGRSVVGDHCRETSHSVAEIQLLKHVRKEGELNAWESYFLHKHREQDQLLNKQPLGNCPSTLYGLG